jgi:PAS domain S-box-containing protein
MGHRKECTDKSSKKPVSILIVDDRSENLKLLVQILKEEGYLVKPALSAQLALGAVTYNRPDLILLDIRMPEMDGFQLCEHLKNAEDTRDIPIIFISALEDIDEKIKAFQVGGVDYITRPFQKAEVTARVRTHLELDRMRRRMESLVQQRTRELQNKTEKLGIEITARRAATAKLKTSEQNYRLLVENIHEVFWIVSKDWKKVHYVSPAYETVWGQSCESLYAVPKSWMDAIAPQDKEKVDQTIKAMRKGSQAKFVFPNFRIQRQPGDVRWIRAKAFPIINSSGDVFRIAGIAEDITQQVDLEGRLRQYQKMEAIGRLAGGIAHEFNNMLGIILGNTELALDDLRLGYPIIDNLEEIKRTSLRAKDVIQQLLDFSHKSDLQHTALDIHLLVKETLKLIRASMPATISIIENYQLDAKTVMADRNLVRQLIINLTTNAFQSMNKNGGFLTIELQNVNLQAPHASHPPGLKPGSYVLLKISDTGHGIPPEIINKVFDPYFTTHAIGQGSGMGLAVAHGIVSNHGGTINVESQIDQGATFRIYLPLAENEATSAVDTDAPIPTGCERILLVDDEQAIAKTMQATLHRLGYAVTVAHDPHEALGMFQSSPYAFDVVITDMTMPKMNGGALAMQILKARADIPVILCTGHSDPMDQQTVKEIGIRGYAQKPIEKRRLAALIRKALEHRAPGQ